MDADLATLSKSLDSGWSGSPSVALECAKATLLAARGQQPAAVAKCLTALCGALGEVPRDSLVWLPAAVVNLRSTYPLDAGVQLALFKVLRELFFERVDNYYGPPDTLSDEFTDMTSCARCFEALKAWGQAPTGAEVVAQSLELLCSHMANQDKVKGTDLELVLDAVLWHGCSSSEVTVSALKLLAHLAKVRFSTPYEAVLGARGVQVACTAAQFWPRLERVAVAAFRTLRHMLLLPECRSLDGLATAAATISLLMGTLGPESSQLCVAGCYALWALTSSGDTVRLLVTCVECALLALEQHPGVNLVARAACGTVYNAASHHAVREHISACGGLTLVLAAMDDHPTDPRLCEEAAGVVWKLCRSGTMPWRLAQAKPRLERAMANHVLQGVQDFGARAVAALMDL